MVYAEDILNKAKKEVEPVTLSTISQGTATGAVIGLVGGALFAYFQQKKYLPCMIWGTLAGGLVTRLLLIKK